MTATEKLHHHRMATEWKYYIQACMNVGSESPIRYAIKPRKDLKGIKNGIKILTV
jgi:hypothetical protein